MSENKKLSKEKVNYGEDIQHLLISMMLSDPSLFVRCQAILKTEYFDKKLQPSVKFMLEYAEKYSGLPSEEIIKAETKFNFEKVVINDSHSEFFLETVEKFCRHKALEAAIIKSFDWIENGFYNDIETIVKDAVLVSLKRDLGLNYYENPRERLERMLKQNGTIKTGWKEVDDIIYNISRGELIIFTAISGGGKSVALQNLAVNWSKQNHNVVYFSFELNQDLVAKRMDALLTDIPNVSIFRQIDKVEYLVKQGEKHNGKIQIVYLPSGTCTNDLRAWLKEYQIQYGIVPDMIMVDYLGLMRPNSKRIDPSNLYIKDKFVSEELRALAAELECVCVTAAQGNRGAYSEMSPGMENIAGGMTQVHTCDLLINITNTAPSRERGEITYTFLKTRNSGGVGKSVVLGYDVETLKISDMNITGQQSHQPFNKQIINAEQQIENEDKAIFDQSNSGQKIAAEKPSLNGAIPPALSRLLNKSKGTI